MGNAICIDKKKLEVKPVYLISICVSNSCFGSQGHVITAKSCSMGQRGEEKTCLTF